MAEHMDIHSEAFEQLIGEALRAGSGSPAWTQAIDTLRAAGSEGDEFALLCRAREDLESGKAYRTVSGGPGFTQKLMDRLDQEDTAGPSFSTSTLIAIAAGIVLFASLVIVGFLVIVPGHPTKTIADLQETFCVTPVVDAKFETSIPQGFRRIGSLPLVARNALVPDVKAKSATQAGGGLYLARSLSANETYAVDVTLALPEKDGGLITQLFVMDEATFTPDKGVSPRELVCLIEAGQLRVMLPDGQTVGETPLLSENAAATLRLKFTNDLAIVEQGGKVVWSGHYSLSQPVRYVGVRYLSPGAETLSGAAVRSLRVMKP